MASYLKPVECCANCNEPFGHIRADDAAPWLTMFIVGIVVGALTLGFERHPLWPDWVAMILWPAVALAMALLILPRAKALFIGLIWASRSLGSE